MSGIFPHNTDKCHCPDCNTVRQQVTDIANSAIGKERLACNREGVRFGNHALREDYAAKRPDTLAASWAKRRESEKAAKLATLRELCRRVCVNVNLGKQAGRDVLEAYGATNCSMLNPAHYDGVIRTYETILAGEFVTDRDAERDARRARVLSPEPGRWDRHVEERGKHVYYSKVSYYDRDHNRTFKWKWRRGIGWMKVAKSGLVFGDRYRKVMFNGLGYNAWHFGSKIGRPDEVYRDDEHGIVRVGPDIIGHSARITAVEHTETKAVGNLSTTTTDRIEFTTHPDVFGDLHTYRRRSDGTVVWLDIRKKVRPGEFDKWHGLRYEARAEDVIKQAMSATPIWAGANTGRWEACNPTISMEITDIDPENLRAAFIGGGAKTGADAEDDPINIGGIMISALKLSILFWRKAHHHSWPYPCKPDREPGLVRSTLLQLERENLVTLNELDYTLTPRAEVLLEAIQNLPLPVQPQTWVMPKA